MDWNKVLEQVLVYVLPVLAVTLVGWVVASVKVAWTKAAAYIKEQYPDLAFEVGQAADFAVLAAEQIWARPDIHDFIVSEFENKKAYALDMAEKYLEMQGVKIDLDIIEAAIEKAVIENFPKNPPALPAK